MVSQAHRYALVVTLALAALGCAGSATKGEPLDLDGVTQVTLTDGYCGGAAGKCYGQRSVAVTLATGDLARRACAEGDAGSGATTRALSPQELQSVRDGLANIRVAPEPHTAQDGHMFVLTLTRGATTKDYSPEASCNHARFTKIVAGFDELMAIVFAL